MKKAGPGKGYGALCGRSLPSCGASPTGPWQAAEETEADKRMTCMAVLDIAPWRSGADCWARGGAAPGACPSLPRSPVCRSALRIDRFQVADPQQIERCQAEDEHLSHLRGTPMARLPQGSDSLHPSKHLFNCIVSTKVRQTGAPSYDTLRRPRSSRSSPFPDLAATICVRLGRVAWMNLPGRILEPQPDASGPASRLDLRLVPSSPTSLSRPGRPGSDCPAPRRQWRARLCLILALVPRGTMA